MDGAWGLNVHDALSHGVTNQPPVADAGPDQVLVDGDGDGAELVTLDGSRSFDPDGTIQSYDWREGGSGIAAGAVPTVALGVGTHALTLLVTDDGGASDTDTVTITIQASATPADTVTIAKATYNTRRQQLAVEATSSGAPNVTLTVYDASNAAAVAEIGALSYDPRKSRYAGSFTWPSKPVSIAVVSSGGGTATGGVGGK